MAAGLNAPTAMAFAPDGRLFVCEQAGRLRVIKDGVLLAAAFVTLTVNSSGERGLLGVAFDPDFASNQYVYLYYTATAPAIHNRVSRFTANGDTALSGSETVILELNNLSSATNHNGGAIHFGPDGKLYIAAGENANSANSQTLVNLLGKILRINPDGSIPLDNPFYNTTSGANQAIWALGLRNPFTFAFQAGTGRMFINDVGNSSWEEINEGIAGSNYGWPNTEGYTTDPAYRSPLHAYPHSSGACAITGGAFYGASPPQFPAEYAGMYFFNDYCAGWIRKFDPATGAVTTFATGISSPVDLKVGPDGNLYYLARGSGLYRIFSTSTQAPLITTQPVNQIVTVGQPASFSVAASGASPLSYQWQRDSVDIPGATASTYSINSAASGDNGAQFRCVVTNSYGSATSNAATLTVTSNSAPTATIVTPAAGTTYRAGQTISYSGTGSDPQDGSLPASAYAWWVDFYHEDHFHPAAPRTTGSTSGSFTIPTSGETSANVWYRIYLEVKDSGGLTNVTYRDILPLKVTLTLASSPSGLQLTLDGQPVTAPYSVQGVVGMTRTLGAVTPQVLNGTAYGFVSWSDGGAATHNISTPSSNTTYTATFRAVGLLGTYFDDPDLTAVRFQRVDPQVNFNFGAVPPDSRITDDGSYSIRWTGQIRTPNRQGTYTFYTTSDDGVRVWVNGRLIIDTWTTPVPAEVSGQIGLKRNRSYSIQIEYCNRGGAGLVSLSWSPPSLVKEVIPPDRLSPQ